MSPLGYCDIRYGSGMLYEKLGFEYVSTSQPNYFYFHKSNILKLESRISFQKHKLKDKLPQFDDNLSEYQNMLNNGYDRIWDCGNLVFKYVSPK